jgi:hypothetical protein
MQLLYQMWYIYHCVTSGHIVQMNLFLTTICFFIVVARYIHSVVQHCLRLYHRRGAKPIVLHRYPPRGLI